MNSSEERNELSTPDEEVTTNGMDLQENWWRRHCSKSNLINFVSLLVLFSLIVCLHHIGRNMEERKRQACTSPGAAEAVQLPAAIETPHTVPARIAADDDGGESESEGSTFAAVPPKQEAVKKLGEVSSPVSPKNAKGSEQAQALMASALAADGAVLKELSPQGAPTTKETIKAEVVTEASPVAKADAALKPSSDEKVAAPAPAPSPIAASVSGEVALVQKSPSPAVNVVPEESAPKAPAVATVASSAEGQVAPADVVKTKTQPVPMEAASPLPMQQKIAKISPPRQVQPVSAARTQGQRATSAAWTRPLLKEDVLVEELDGEEARQKYLAESHQIPSARITAPSQQEDGRRSPEVSPSPRKGPFIRFETTPHP